MKKIVNEFLRENNAIEGVHDETSLIQAEQAWFYLMEYGELTTNIILKTHKILMLHQNLQPDEKGYFRNCEVRIGNKYGLNYVKIHKAIEHLVMNINDVVENGKNENYIFKENISKEHHILYEKIHPFIDGNGRTGRMLMNWERIKLGLPILIIHEGKEQLEYYKWFR